MSSLIHKLSTLALVAFLAAGTFSLSGCERDVLDVNTPNGGMEIERNDMTGETSVDVSESKAEDAID